MTGIIASTINTNQREISNTSPVPKKTEKDQSNEVKDKVDIKGGFKKAAKYTLGAGISVIVAPLNCISRIPRGINGAIEAGLKGAGLESDKLPDSTGSKLEYVAIGLLAPIGGAVLGASMGLPGMLLGVVMAPGVVGGLIEAGKGAVEGYYEGGMFAANLATEVDEKVSKKFGKIAGIAAGLATAVSSSVICPVGAVIGSVDKGINFAMKAIGVKGESGYKESTLENHTKYITVLGSYFVGATNAPGFISAIPVATVLSGGVATAVSAVREGANGFVDGVKMSMKLADYFVG